MKSEKLTSESEKITSENVKKIELLEVELRHLLSKNEELSWTDLDENLEIKSTSQLSKALATLKENGEIDKGRCSEKHRNQDKHNDCRKCYSLSGGGTIAFNHIKRKLTAVQEGTRTNKLETLRYLDLWIGNGPYDFSKFHTFETIEVMIKLLRNLHKDNNIRVKASLTYNFLPNIIAHLKSNSKKKAVLSNLLEENICDILKEFHETGVGNHIHTEGDVISDILCSQLMLGQISLFKKIKDLMKLTAMQTAEYADIRMKYAPIKYILSKLLGSDNNCKQLLVTNLKSHQIEFIDMYASCREEDHPFLGYILNILELK